MRFAVPLVLALAIGAGAAAAATAQHPDEAGVRAVESGWSEAFITGNAAALEALLDPAYVSVGANGKARPKAEIIALARSYAAQHPGQHADPLPATSTVQIMGTTALVRHHGTSDVSIDLFAFEHGQWRAKYSQHTAIAPAA
jgi:hypothetical protein